MEIQLTKMEASRVPAYNRSISRELPGKITSTSNIDRFSKG